MSPNFVCLLIVITGLIIMTKSFIVASAWLSIPVTWYLTLGYDVKIAMCLLIIAGVYSQLVVLYRSKADDNRPSQTVRGR